MPQSGDLNKGVNMMTALRRWAAGPLLLVSLSAAPAYSQQNSANATVHQDEYVRLEVRLELSGATGPMRFDFCPDQKLWEIDLRSLLAGASQMTLGVSISGPSVGPLTLTPVTIEQTRGGWLGLERKCTVNIDEIIYRSPAVSVRRHSGAAFNVGPSYVRSVSVNPGAQPTVATAWSLAAKLPNVPAETAAPYQTQITNILSSISIGHRQTLTRNFLIQPGPAPSAEAGTWIAASAVPRTRSRPARDLVLTARLIPLRSLISDPPSDAARRTQRERAGACS